MKLKLTALAIVMAANSFASFFVTCDVTAEVLEMQSRPVLSKTNPNEHPFFVLAEIGLKSIDETEPGSHQECDEFATLTQRIQSRFNIVLQGKWLRLVGLKKGDELKLEYHYSNGRTELPYPFRTEESWLVNKQSE